MGIMGAPWLRGRVDAGWGILPTPGALPEEGRRYRPSGEWCLDDCNDPVTSPWQVLDLRAGSPTQPHFESPQLRQVMQPSIMIMALVMHLLHSCAPAG